jgi:hypothetical protein
MSEPTTLTGGCNCGAVRFELGAPPVAAIECWCGRCRRRSGCASSPNARTERGSLRIVAGEAELGAWDPGDGGWEKLFCRSCGSQIGSRDPGDAECFSVRFGAFDEDPGVRVTAHQFTAYAAPWAELPDDGLPRHPERAPA